MSQPASSYLPSGLNDGDVFRLIFVTNGGMLCVDSSLPQIDTYNDFVQTQWQASSIRLVIEQYLGVSITFKCIASTSAVNAKDNILPDVGAPFMGVYKLNQAKIADATNDLWTPALLFPISTDQTGSLLAGTFNVWTGTKDNGDKDGFLGQDCHGCINVGSSNAVSTGWINAALVDSCPGGSTPAKHFYAISDNITWPAHADYLPADVSPGETFQLAFVMDDTSPGGVYTPATSSSISVYNAQVQAAWVGSTPKSSVENFLGTSITFNCIGSTLGTNAKDNAKMGSGASFKGVYTLNQAKIADATNPTYGLYGPSGNHGLLPPTPNMLNINQNGETASGIPSDFVWTGSYQTGVGDGPLGGTPNPTVGHMTQDIDTKEWINNGFRPAVNTYSLYALSEVLTWPVIPSPPVTFCMNDGVWAKYQKKSPYGRWNNTNSNLKLFPMTICHGVGGKIIRKQTKNIFKNASPNMSQKQQIAFLIRNGIGPYSR